MFLANLTNRGATPALEATLVFNQARLRTIAENMANVHTPGYRAKQLDGRAFQRALREALDAKGSDRSKVLIVESGREVRTDRSGSMHVRPSERPLGNALQHDGTNMSIEKQMADLAETGMMHELATTLLKGSYDGLRKAIRGQV